jgi:cysteinyl-tRNA synthetase
VIKLTELFSGNHPLLEKAYSPMTVRFFILQTHYRSTLDFSNEALQAAEKGLKRLLEAHEWLQETTPVQSSGSQVQNEGEENLDEKVRKLLDEFDEFLNDDFNTAKVLANMFELVPVINSLKDKTISLLPDTWKLLQEKMKTYVEDIFGLQSETAAEADKLKGVMQVLIELRREARAKKDWVTSDKIRNQLAAIGIQLKDEKDGNISWSI